MSLYSIVRRPGLEVMVGWTWTRIMFGVWVDTHPSEYTIQVCAGPFSLDVIRLRDRKPPVRRRPQPTFDPSRGVRP